MITQHDISLEEEALIYQKAFYSQIEEEEEPKRSRPPSRSIKRSSTPGNRIVCYKCGGVGHTSGMCDGELPTYEEIRNEMFIDVKEIIDQAFAEGTYGKDEFGLYKNDTESPVEHDKSWKRGAFCVNCGEFGHIAKDCQKPRYQTIENDLKKYYKDNFTHPTKPLEEIKELFMDSY